MRIPSHHQLRISLDMQDLMDMPTRIAFDNQESNSDGRAKLNAQYHASSGASATSPLSTSRSPALAPQSPSVASATIPHVVQVSQICNRAVLALSDLSDIGKQRLHSAVMLNQKSKPRVPPHMLAILVAQVRDLLVFTCPPF